MRKQTVTLLVRLETVTHGARVREAIALGRRALTDADAADTLAELERGNFYEWMLALLAAHGTRSGDTVTRFLSDASTLLRGLAASLVPLFCTDEQALVAVQNATRRGRVRLLRDLLKRRRFAPVDAFVSGKIAQESDETGEYLPFCSEVFVREQLPTFAERFDFHDWQRLTRAHPDVATEAIEAYLAAQTEPDARLRYRLNAVLPMLAATRPQQSLALITQALRHESPDALRLGALVSYLPEQVADLLLSQPARFDVRLSVTGIRRLMPKGFLALLSERPEYLPAPQAYLPHLPAETREKAFAIAGESWKTGEGIIAPAVVAALPTRLRVSEARRHFALPALATRPMSRLPYAAFLPPAEAQTVLEPFIKNPDADLRGVALAARVGTARYHADTLGGILQIMRRRENEQDPVRRFLLQAVRELPPSRWLPEHLPELGQIIRDALNAADLSSASAAEAERVVVSLLPFHPVWSSTWLGVLVKERGQVSLYGLESRLTSAGMQAIAPEVRMNTYNRFATEPLLDPNRVILPRLLERLNSPLTDEATAAANAVFEMYNEKDAAVMGRAISGTLPNRASLTAVLDVFTQRFTPYKTRFPLTIRAVLSALAADPLTASYQARIAASALSGADAGAALAQVPLHPEALMSAVTAAEALPITDAIGLENALKQSPDDALRRVAFAALVAQARAKGWDAARRERHATYCRDDSPLVAAAAQSTILPPTTETGG